MSSLLAPAVHAQEDEAPPDDQAAETAELEPIEALDLDWLLSTPIVESVTKRVQAFFDAPAEITVITPEEIQIRAADSVAELFRQLPGAWVAQTSAQVFNVGLRGLNQVSNNHVLTLLDGRNLAAPTLGYTPWALLPLHPAEIEKIEVVYGPGTTMYGANAFSGVINISSRRPLDHPGAEFAFSGGAYVRQEENDDYMLNTGGSGYTAYNWVNEEETIGIRLSAGFSHIPEWDELPAMTKLPTEEQEDGSLEPQTGLFSYYTRLMFQYVPDDATELLFYVSHAHTENSALVVTMLDTEPMEQMEQTFGLQLSNTGWLGEDLTLSLGIDGNIANTYMPTTEEFDNFGVHGFAQLDIRLFDDRDELSLGFESSYLVGQDFLDVDPSSTYLAAYFQNELVILNVPRLILDLGLRWEQVTVQDGHGSEIVYRNANPNAALVLNINDEHGLWLSAATAYRTPTILESVTRFTLEGDEDAPLPTALANNLQLRPTEVISMEVGYRLALQERYQLSLVVFHQWIDDVIIPAPVPDLPLQFVNGQDLVQTGGTLRGGVAITEGWRLDAWYTYTHTDTTRGPDRGEWPEHLAGLTVDSMLTSRLHLTTALKVVSETFSTHVRMDAESLQVDTVEVGPNAYLDLRLGYGIANGAGEVFVAGRNLVGLFLDPQDLPQYPVAASQPIGGSVIIGVQLSDL